MADPKDTNVSESTPDQLINSGINASDELTDKALEGVAGGDKIKIQQIQQDVTVNKAKTADKAFNAMDGYVRG
jgi:hypothetical protein